MNFKHYEKDPKLKDARKIGFVYESKMTGETQLLIEHVRVYTYERTIDKNDILGEFAIYNKIDNIEGKIYDCSLATYLKCHNLTLKQLAQAAPKVLVDKSFYVLD